MQPLAIVCESTVEADCPQPEIDELRENSEEIGAALRALGYRTEVLPFVLDLGKVRAELLSKKPSVVFNLVDAIEGKGDLISLPPLLLEHMEIPFTGNGSIATATTCHKLVTKQILHSADVPTPHWFTEEEILSLRAPLKTPYIVKSITEHASFGLYADSVVHDTASLQSTFAVKKGKYGGEWFAEAYIDGREFNLSVLATEAGPVVLPPAEIIFTDDFPKDAPRIVDYIAKWHYDSPECIGTVRNFTFAETDAKLLEKLQSIALKCWHAFGLSGYARVDYRIDQQGNPLVLEVNSNPFLTAEEGFGAAGSRAKMNFTQVIHRIVEDAYRRKHMNLPASIAA